MTSLVFVIAVSGAFFASAVQLSSRSALSPDDGKAVAELFRSGKFSTHSKVEVLADSSLAQHILSKIQKRGNQTLSLAKKPGFSKQCRAKALLLGKEAGVDQELSLWSGGASLCDLVAGECPFTVGWDDKGYSRDWGLFAKGTMPKGKEQFVDGSSFHVVAKLNVGGIQLPKITGSCPLCGTSQEAQRCTVGMKENIGVLPKTNMAIGMGPCPVPRKLTPGEEQQIAGGEGHGLHLRFGDKLPGHEEYTYLVGQDMLPEALEAFISAGITMKIKVKMFHPHHDLSIHWKLVVHC